MLIDFSSLINNNLLRPVYTGDFCRAIRCNFCRAKVARSCKARLHTSGDFCRATQCNFCRAEVASSFEHVRNLMQLHGDKNCIELRDKNRLCKRAFRQLSVPHRSLIHNSGLPKLGHYHFILQFLARKRCTNCKSQACPPNKHMLNIYLSK